jgi:hypothetical protein
MSFDLVESHEPDSVGYLSVPGMIRASVLLTTYSRIHDSLVPLLTDPGHLTVYRLPRTAIRSWQMWGRSGS